MRKLILASAFALASFVALAADSRNLVLAANDTSTAAATTAPAAEPAAAAAETAKPAAPRKQAAKKPVRESDEQKARRIAAKYGVYW